MIFCCEQKKRCRVQRSSTYHTREPITNQLSDSSPLQLQEIFREGREETKQRFLPNAIPRYAPLAWRELVLMDIMRPTAWRIPACTGWTEFDRTRSPMHFLLLPEQVECRIFNGALWSSPPVTVSFLHNSKIDNSKCKISIQSIASSSPWS